MFRKRPPPLTAEPILLTCVHITTFNKDQLLTNASGFFFERDKRLFLITSRHVLSDPANNHAPDRIDIVLHTDVDDMSKSEAHSIALYKNQSAYWRQGEDSGGPIDVAAVEIDRTKLPISAVFRAFTPDHLVGDLDSVEVASPLAIVGYPLGFHDTRHHMPVVRHAIIASSFGMRFQGQGFFLTDGRTHRGSSGAPVVMRMTKADRRRGELPWLLLGCHSARFDMGSRDLKLDEALGLNCAWYADIIMTLTKS